MPAQPAVLITGATRGLGRNIALALAAQGRDLIIGGRRAAAVHELCDTLESLGITAAPFIADLADLDDVRRALDALETRTIVCLHGIVANAGITTQNVDARSAQGFELSFAVEVLAHQLLLLRLAPHLGERTRVVVVSSGAHEPDHENRHEHHQGRDSSSKLANILQARGLQRALRTQGREIDVFAIDPGLMVDPKHICALLEQPQWLGQGFAYLNGDRVEAPPSDALRDDSMLELWREANAFVGLEHGHGLSLS